ncbi:MAG: glycerate kinase type-2 family protein [Candidatus Anammoxibacter sp.]
MTSRVINKLKKDAWDIFLSALQAVDPVFAVKKSLKLSGSLLEIGGKQYDLDRFERVIVVGAGKAGAPMSRALEEILGDRITLGHVNVKYGHLDKVNKIKIHEAGHPSPDQPGYDGAKKIFNILQKSGEKDLVIFLLSGGGSALMPLPANKISLIEKKQTTNHLLSCGATIEEINAIRKHISRLKGGWLANTAFPSTLITLIISDVIGDPLDAIASGPTVPDHTTYADCLSILKRYDIIDKVPAKVLHHLNQGAAGLVKETPKANEFIFQKVQNVIIANNTEAFNAAQRKTIELGYNTLMLSTMIEGETREVAKVHTAIAKEIRKSGNPVKRPACLLSGGETTVTIRGSGLGGRNQEFALASAIEIAGQDQTIVFSAATDGTDGPLNPAGAVADGFTTERALRLNMNPVDYLMNNDSYRFFLKLGDLITTGPTNTNVMDIRIILVV